MLLSHELSFVEHMQVSLLLGCLSIWHFYDIGFLCSISVQLRRLLYRAMILIFNSLFLCTLYSLFECRRLGIFHELLKSTNNDSQERLCTVIMCILCGYKIRWWDVALCWWKSLLCINLSEHHLPLTTHPTTNNTLTGTCKSENWQDNEDRNVKSKFLVQRRGLLGN